MKGRGGEGGGLTCGSGTQVLTCVSVRLSEAASSMRSCTLSGTSARAALQLCQLVVGEAVRAFAWLFQAHREWPVPGAGDFLPPLLHCGDTAASGPSLPPARPYGLVNVAPGGGGPAALEPVGRGKAAQG